jgi:hypothetical protein
VRHGSFIVDGDDQRVALADRLVTIPDGGMSEGDFPRRLHVFLALSSGRRGVLRQFDTQLAASARVRQRGGCDDQFQATADASEEWVALATDHDQTCTEGAGTFFVPGPVVVSVARYAGSAIVVERCSAAEEAFGAGEGVTGSITGQLDGSVLAYESCDRRSIIVRDLSTQAPPAVVPIGQLIDGFAIAGGYLAVEPVPALVGSASQVSVYRWGDAALVGTFGGGVIDLFAVDRSGTLATLYEPASAGSPSGGCVKRDYSLAVLRVGQSSARVLPVTPCGDVLSISDGQILFERILGPRTADIAVTDTSGSQPREVLPSPDLVDFAPDGQLRREVAACGNSVEYQFAPLALPLAAPRALPPCRAYFAGRDARLRSGVLSIRLRCPYGCGGTLTLRVLRTGKRLRFTQTPANAIAFFAPPGLQVEEAGLTQTSLRALRPGARLKATLVVHAAEPAGDPIAQSAIATRVSTVLAVR